MPNRYPPVQGRRSDTYTMNRGGAMLGNEGDNAFNSVLLTKPNGSVFDLTHHVNLTGQIGKLMPVMCEEVYPGDNWHINHEVLVRFQPMLSPAMQRFDVRVESFMIPNRILWDKWEEFLRGESFALPYLSLTNGQTDYGTLADYLGIPRLQAGTNSVKVQALPFVAYQRVFYDYYRNQNLSAMTDNDMPVALTGDNASQAAMLLSLRNRAYQHDYFTSALPFTQKGTQATIQFNFNDVPVKTNTVAGAGGPNFTLDIDAIGNGAETVTIDFQSPTGSVGSGNRLYADTSTLSGTSFTINEFRLALATQHWLERMAVGGTRYIEMIRAHFGVQVEDYRLDRPEYIGGMKTPVVVSEVLQNSETNTTPQGNMSGHAIAAAYGDNGEHYYVKEHGWIITILSVLPKATYASGLRRFMSWDLRNTRDEFYWPEFANLGEQAIKKVEVFADLGASAQQEDWGYTSRFNELRYIPNRIAGQFKDSLSFWSGARIFENLPPLNETFITDVQSDMAKLFSVTPTAQAPELICHVLNEISAYRLLPKYAVPELVG